MCFKLEPKLVLCWLTTCDTMVKPHVRECGRERVDNQIGTLTAVFAEAFWPQIKGRIIERGPAREASELPEAADKRTVNSKAYPPVCLFLSLECQKRSIITGI